jgi:hypothetical protein
MVDIFCFRVVRPRGRPEGEKVPFYIVFIPFPDANVSDSREEIERRILTEAIKLRI